jgi:hypothetical protein
VGYINSSEWVSRACIYRHEQEILGEGLILVVQGRALMRDCGSQVVTHILTDIAPERLHVGMVKEGCKDGLALDSQQIDFTRTITSNDRVLPSVEILVSAEPSPEFAKDPITGCVRRATAGVTPATRNGTYILRDWWRPRWLRGYRRAESASQLADCSQTR